MRIAIFPILPNLAELAVSSVGSQWFVAQKSLVLSS